MAHVVDVRDVPHEQLDEDDGDEVIDVIDASEVDGASVQDQQANGRPWQVRRSLSMVRTSKRAKLVTAVVTALCIFAVSVGIIVYSSSNRTVATDTTTANPVPTAPVTVQAAELPSFLKLSVEADGSAVFVLDKATWNESFIVYPTVVKHSAPPHWGMERGSVLLSTSHYVFHFEKTPDDRYLLLVLENHLARLQDEDDELKQAFDDSQWPGYMTRVTIYSETEDAYYFGTEPFLAHGFFVSFPLMTPYYTLVQGGSSFYPRNSNIQVEYELDDGILRANYAIGLLPSTPMNQRIADDRIGYFMQRYVQYGVDNEDPVNATAEGFQYMDKDVTVINRRRLDVDPKTGKTKNPIVYHIDPSVPERWRDAFVKGVVAWAPAFEAIGFKDAIKAITPDDDDWPEDYRIGDLRYNSISVMISDDTYAIGPSVFDPRSGEILHSDITFEYGFFNAVVTDFDIRSPIDFPTAALAPASAINGSRSQGHLPHQCGIGRSPQDQLDRTMLAMLLSTKMGVVPDSVIGSHFTDVVMHEVGHTLGLRHNFAGSSQISRANLADKKFTSAHGVSGSIMDYVSVNAFSDLTDAAAKSHDFYQSVIGDYDKAAIAYGYSIVDDETPTYPSKKLSKIAQAAPLFLTDEDTDTWTNPYAQRFDISSDPIDYANDRLELIKILRNQSLVSKLADDAPWSNLWRYERTLLRQINITVSIVQPFLGGVKATHAHRKAGETSFTVPFVSKGDQLRALGVLARVIRADDGLFPDPAQYASYVQVTGYSGEDCNGPSNDFGCLARKLVDIDSKIKFIRQHAVVAALFPALDRIISQDASSPLTIFQVLSVVEIAASTDLELPRNQVIYAFYREVLKYLIESEDEDSRLRMEVWSFYNATAGGR